VEDRIFEGLMPALITPFDEEGELDLRATEAVVERALIESGVDGISALGSTGEFSQLDHLYERFGEALVEMIEGRFPLIVSVGTTGTRKAVDLAHHAESIGANDILSV
jgi:dihydrodipicolinate synthase/N-acetylneuraminate lyase